MANDYLDYEGLQRYTAGLKLRMDSKYGAPLVAATAAAMTDTTRVYVYTGSETGYSTGHWYYYDGNSWADGGVYQAAAVQTDTTLSISGEAADAKSTGIALRNFESFSNAGSFTIPASDIENGTWAYSAKAASTHRLRCSYLVPVRAGMRVVYTNPSMGVFFGVLSDMSSGSYLQNSGWISAGAENGVYYISNDGWMTVIFENTSTVSPSDYDSTISLFASRVALTYVDVSGMSSFGVADLPVNSYTYTQLSSSRVFTDAPAELAGTEWVYISKEQLSNNVALNFVTVCDVLNGITYRATNRDAGTLPANLWPWKRILTNDDEEEIDTTLGLISENTDNLFDIRQVTPAVSNVSVTLTGHSFEVKAATAATYQSAIATLVLDASTKYTISAVKDTVAGVSGVYYAESSDGGSTYGSYNALIGFGAEDEVINSQSFVTTTGYVKLGFFCAGSEAAAGDAVFSDVMLCKGGEQKYVPQLTAVDFVARNSLTPQTNLKTVNILRKVLCAGDSYTAGWINTSGTGATHKDCSWPTYAGLITGNTYVNCGVSGASSLSWLSSASGLAAAQAAGVVQAYIVQFMINDALTPAVQIPVGDTADIGDENPTTFYGAYSKVIRELSAISPDAIIFVCTCPFFPTIPSGYQQAVRDIAEAYADDYNVHLLDMKKDERLFKNASLTGDKINLHYTAVGYEQFAEIYTYYISNYINTHIADFQEVCDIPYDS